LFRTLLKNKLLPQELCQFFAANPTAQLARH
jgi:hypothetical protein